MDLDGARSRRPRVRLPHRLPRGRAATTTGSTCCASTRPSRPGARQGRARIKAAQKSGRPATPRSRRTSRRRATLVAPRAPLLMITHGLSGSGKTHVTEALIGGLRAVACALGSRAQAPARPRRERAFGLRRRRRALRLGARPRAPTSGSPRSRPPRCATDSTRSSTRRFLRRAERDAFSRIAKQHNARFAILDCVAPKEVLRRRIAARAAEQPRRVRSHLEVLDHQLADSRAARRATSSARRSACRHRAARRLGAARRSRSPLTALARRAAAPRALQVPTLARRLH